MRVEGKPRPHDIVVKDNALVHASYIMERQEKMLMWFVIWAFQQKRSKRLTLKCSDVAEFAGMDRNAAYVQTWETARRLRERELLIHNQEKGRIGACGFLSYVEYGKDRAGEVDVEITDQIVPHVERFIEGMKIGFTKFEMGVIASLKSFYALRLYEICKSVHFGRFAKEGWELEVDELRKRFGVLMVNDKGKTVVDSYADWRRFREKVLDKAVDEVNEASDLRIAYRLRKSGRNVVAVRFFVSRNRPGALVMSAVAGDKDLVQRMSRLGVGSTTMSRLLRQYGATDRGRLEYALAETEMAMKTGKVKKPAAWFVAAVKRDDRAQGELLSPERLAEERRLEAAEKARDAQLRARPATGGEPKSLAEVMGDSSISLGLEAVLQRMEKRVKRTAD